MSEAVAVDDMVAKESEEAPIQRLHPLTVLLDLLKMMRQNIIAIVVLHFGVLDSNWLYSGGLFAGLTLLLLIISWVKWNRISYQLGREEIRIKSGIISRNNRSLPLERIQDVSLEQKLLHRILGLAAVKMETGASSGEDDKLEALSLLDAEQLRDTIRDLKSGQLDVADDEIAEPAEEAEPLFAMDTKRIFIAGLFNFSFVLFAIIAALAQQLEFVLDVPYFEVGYWIDRFREQAQIVDGLSMAAQIAGIAGALFSLIIVGSVSGVIRTFVREFGFRLDRVDGGFRRRRGLFTLTDMVMPLHRVQAAILRTGPIKSRFGWQHLKFQSLASDASGQSGHSAAPLAQMHEIDPILAETEIANLPESVEFRSVHSAYWWRDALLALLLLAAIGVGNGIFVHPAFYALPLISVPLVGWMILNWRHHKFALTPRQLIVKAGWWRRKLTILPIRKVQTVDVSQSLTDHPLKLATVTVGVAGGSVVAPLRIKDVPVADALNIRKSLLVSDRLVNTPATV